MSFEEKPSESFESKVEATFRQTPKPYFRDWLGISIAVFAYCLIACLTIYGNWNGIKFKPGMDLPGVVGIMLLTSLFIERTVEVFMVVFRDPKAADHERKCEFWQSRSRQLGAEIVELIAEKHGMPQPDAERMSAIDTSLKSRREAVSKSLDQSLVEEAALLPFRSSTHRNTALCGLGIGMALAAVGFRLFSQLVEATELATKCELPLPQSQWFGVIDIILTGAVLSGGSQAINKLFAVYSAYMESTRKQQFPEVEFLAGFVGNWECGFVNSGMMTKNSG
jgi:hypothetical protein